MFTHYSAYYVYSGFLMCCTKGCQKMIFFFGNKIIAVRGEKEYVSISLKKLKVWKSLQQQVLIKTCCRDFHTFNFFNDIVTYK